MVRDSAVGESFLERLILYVNQADLAIITKGNNDVHNGINGLHRNCRGDRWFPRQDSGSSARPLRAAGDGRRSLNQQMLPGYCVAVGAATSGGACPVANSVIAAASCESAQLACPGGG